MNMRSLPLAFLLLAGCAGNVADYVGPRSSIVTPQLIRYGLPVADARCIGERLGKSLTPLQLRRLVRAAGAVKQGYYDSDPLNIGHFAKVATAMQPPKVGAEVQAASAACNIVTAAAAPPTPSGPQGAETPPMPAPRTPAWLNLGAAGTGQQIAVEASSIEQEGSRRSAWFRLTDPGASAPGQNNYHLGIDCGARTISEKARRKPDASGATVEVPGDNKPAPIERGTVMEIAWLALCT
jgi:hypothetical protein